MKQAIYLAVYVPEFPAQALLRLRPELLRKPVAVLRGAAPFQQVCSTNAPARALGVHVGMTRAQVDSFSGLHTLSASYAEEENARTALLEAAAIFTPRIEAQPALDAAFAMVLDMTGTQTLWGHVTCATRRIARVLQGMRFITWIAASSNVSASLCLASQRQREPLVVAEGNETSMLAPLPLSALKLKPDLAVTFNLWGIHTLGDLAALPVHDVVARLGSEGRKLHAMASGTQPHFIVPEESPFQLEERIEFDVPVEMMDSLLFVLAPMLEQLIRRADNRSYALASVTTILSLDGGVEHVRTIRPALPARDRRALLKLIQLDLHAHPPSAGVLKMKLAAEPGCCARVQGGLFSPQLPEPMQLDVTLARIAAVVGQDHVGYAELLDKHSEDAIEVRRFEVSHLHGSVLLESKDEARTAFRRCRPPVPLRVSMQCEQGSQHPHTFFLHGKFYTVVQALGPWRRSGGWWSSEVWAQEEWEIQASHRPQQDQRMETLLCVLSWNLLQKSWTLAGWYD